MLKTGMKAPSFELMSEEGKKVSLKDFAGKKVVLYFYPKDDTPGCTKEACSFSENQKKLQKAGAAVIGISADSVASHQKFKKKYDLGFTLLSDPDKEVIKKYDVWKEKSMYGKKYMGIERTTFIIDEQGKITHIFPKVKVTGHTDEVLNVL
jgi:thioredoxin-dependent peroxiredoxin